jgi:phage terminase large subunit-like protein
MEGGKVAWPADAAWRAALETKLLTFATGRREDIVDTLAYAAAEVALRHTSPVRGHRRR